MRLLKWLVGGALMSFSLFALSLHFGKVEVNMNFGSVAKPAAHSVQESVLDAQMLALGKLRHSMPYASAREILVEGGWQPVRFPWQDMQQRCSHRDDVCGKYMEAEACSGTGIGYCKFWFVNFRGKKVVVITVGEGVETLAIDKWGVE